MKTAAFFSPADETSAPKKRLSAPARGFTREVLFPYPIVKNRDAKEKCVRGCRCEISEEEARPRAAGKPHKCERRIPFSPSRRFLSKGGDPGRFGVKAVQNDKKSVHFFKCTLFSDRFFFRFMRHFFRQKDAKHRAAT